MSTKYPYQQKIDPTGPLPNHNSWLANCAYCSLCGGMIIVTQPQESGCDYHWYCADKRCEHSEGEDTGDMETPEWVVRKGIRAKTK